jgi:hypothetical protein
MTRDWKYRVYLGLLAGVLVLAILSQERTVNWRVTLARDDKNPYGAYALARVLSQGLKVEHRYKTIYELKDSLSNTAGMFVLAENFDATREDVRAMLAYAKDGGALFISASSIYGPLADTLKIRTKFGFRRRGDPTHRDSAFIQLRNITLDTVTKYHFKKQDIINYLAVDDAVPRAPFPAELIAGNDEQQPVALKITLGKGYIVLNSTPLIFTNYELLRGDNHQLVSSLLSYLPRATLYWTEYYQSGRREARSPLRFILSNEPLRWAYYVAVGSMLVFMIFEAKRKQRIIPVIKPLPNTTVDFVQTVGGLYYESADHKNIALKKILFFQEALRTRFFFTLPIQSPNYVEALSLKAGADENSVRKLVDTIRNILSQTTISEEELRTLHRELETFWTK